VARSKEGKYTLMNWIFGEFSGWVGTEGEGAFRMKAVGVG
jgi:hypothetical protein